MTIRPIAQYRTELFLLKYIHLQDESLPIRKRQRPASPLMFSSSSFSSPSGSSFCDSSLEGAQAHSTPLPHSQVALPPISPSSHFPGSPLSSVSLDQSQPLSYFVPQGQAGLTTALQDLPSPHSASCTTSSLPPSPMPRGQAGAPCAETLRTGAPAALQCQYVTINVDSSLNRPSVIQSLEKQRKTAKPKGLKKAPLTYGPPSPIDLSIENLDKFKVDLRLAIEKEYSLSDVIPLVEDTGAPRFEISFFLHKIKIGSSTFVNLHDIEFPVSLPPVTISLPHCPTDRPKILSKITLDGKCLALGSFSLPMESSSSVTSLVLRRMEGYSLCDDGLLPGTQPPSLKISFEVEYSFGPASAPSSSSYNGPLPAPSRGPPSCAPTSRGLASTAPTSRAPPSCAHATSGTPSNVLPLGPAFSPPLPGPAFSSLTHSSGPAVTSRPLGPAFTSPSPSPGPAANTRPHVPTITPLPLDPAPTARDSTSSGECPEVRENSN